MKNSLIKQKINQLSQIECAITTELHKLKGILPNPLISELRSSFEIDALNNISDDNYCSNISNLLEYTIEDNIGCNSTSYFLFCKNITKSFSIDPYCNFIIKLDPTILNNSSKIKFYETELCLGIMENSLFSRFIVQVLNKLFKALSSEEKANFIVTLSEFCRRSKEKAILNRFSKEIKALLIFS